MNKGRQGYHCTSRFPIISRYPVLRLGFEVVAHLAHRAGSSASDENMDQAICHAIAARRLLAFSYEGLERVVEPHRCGNNTAGHDALLGWLVRGHSKSGAGPGWRTYLLTEMRLIRVLEESFESARPGYDPADPSMRVVYCQLPPVSADSGAVHR